MRISLAIMTLIIGAMFSLTACSVSENDCDPRYDKGFLNKLGCTVSGTYSDRVEKREQKLADLKAEHELLLKEKKRLDDEDALINASMAERNRQLSALERNLAAVRADVKRKSGDTAALQAKIDEVQQSLNALKSTDDDAAILEKQVLLEKLKAEYDELLELTAI